MATSTEDPARLRNPKHWSWQTRASEETEMYENAGQAPQPTGNLHVDHPAAANALDVFVEQAVWLDEDSRAEIRSKWLGIYPMYAAQFDQWLHWREITKTTDDNDRIEFAARRRFLDMQSNELATKWLADKKFKESGATASVMMPAGDFLFGDDDLDDEPIWGEGDDVLMADGEALMICGQSGVGKTTLAIQFLRARMGLQSNALGYPVKKTNSKILYLACDRPRQWRRAMRRRFNQGEQEALSNLVVVRKGPPPKDLAANPLSLLELCIEAGADTVIIDSLKDVALGLSKDDVGAGYNQARQNCLSNGIQVLELHHNVKRIEGAPTISDVYGSTWITSGAGSVIMLDGKPGDPVVKFWHVKQPVNEIGPCQLIHDQETGVSAFAERVDVVALCRVKAMSARETASVMFDTEKPTPSEKKKAERALDNACKLGLIISIPSITPNQPTMYAAPSIAHTVPTQPEAPEVEQLFD